MNTVITILLIANALLILMIFAACLINVRFRAQLWEYVDVKEGEELLEAYHRAVRRSDISENVLLGITKAFIVVLSTWAALRISCIERTSYNADQYDIVQMVEDLEAQGITVDRVKRNARQNDNIDFLSVRTDSYRGKTQYTYYTLSVPAEDITDDLEFDRYRFDKD